MENETNNQGNDFSILGRNQKDIEKYGTKGTAYVGKVVMSSGENPVLGRKVLIDIARPHMMLICGKRGGGKCLEGDTLITLSDGSLVKIKDLEKDKRKIMSLNNSCKIKEAYKDEFYKRQTEKMLEIELETGKKIKLTPEHPLLTEQGWRPAKELSIGSKIATAKKLDIFGNENMKDQEIKLTAYFIATGTTNKKYILFHNLNEETKQDLKTSIKELDNQNKIIQEKEPNYIAIKNTKKIKELLINTKIINTSDKQIPEKIFKLPKEKLALFLNTLFKCNNQQEPMKYYFASEKLAKQIQHLLLRFGIVSKLTNKKKDAKYEIEIKKDFIQKFEEEIKLCELKSEIKTQQIENQITIETNEKNSRQKMLQIIKTNEDTKNETTQTENHIYWDTITSIKEITGKFEVYDISVPNTHNFIANDIIVHNSYSLGILIEEFARQPIEIRSRMSVIVIDTVGIFWSMKIPTKNNTSELEKWELKPEPIEIKVMVPKGQFEFYKRKDLPIDGAFTIRTSELDSHEWMSLFKVSWKEPEGSLIARVIENAKAKLGTFYGLDDLIESAKNDTESEKNVKDAVAGRFATAKTWGLFEKEGSKIKDLARPNTITIIDVSSYRQAAGMEGTRDIIVGIIGKRLFEERMLYRKEEEIRVIKGFSRESDLPIIWMLIDEAHMFMPKDEDSIALSSLLEWVRVGRQPGLSLVLATQRPNKLHPDCISQCDIFISHRMTAQPDIEAVSQLRPSYLYQNFDKYYQEMPRGKGFALILDDETEKIWLVKMRPRLSWDSGITASAFRE
jgi:hypothetical protein